MEGEPQKFMLRILCIISKCLNVWEVGIAEGPRRSYSEPKLSALTSDLYSFLRATGGISRSRKKVGLAPEPKTHLNPSVSRRSILASPVEAIRGVGALSLYELNTASVSFTSARRSFGYTAGIRTVLGWLPAEVSLPEGGRGWGPPSFRRKAASQHLTNQANVVDLSASGHLTCLWNDTFLCPDSRSRCSATKRDLSHCHTSAT